MTTPPLKPTKTLAEVLERIKARLPEEPPPPAGPAIPLPTTDAPPPTPWQDQEPTP